MIHFGPWSTLLAIGVAFGLTVALLLLFTRTNATANRLLAALLVVFALKLMPYVLGFAGYYDAFPWLSFAPFDLGLSIGPLFYLHVRRLTASSMPSNWAWHLLPGAVQMGYYATMFAQPLARKNQWNTVVHAPWIDPLETLLELLSFAIYLWLTLRTYREYQRWLDAHLSNREEFRIVWLRNVLLAFLLVWPVWAAYEALSYSIDFNYFQRFPLYVFITLVLFYLGLEGWRHAGTVYPLVTTELPSMPEPTQHTEPAGRDWESQGREWLTRTEEAGWWRDPDLSLERLSRHLGTNTAYLSRALNDGLGVSFNAAINRLRVIDVCRRLSSGGPDDDLLTVAFAAGFNSKTSFNRTFKAQIGKTPSQFRESATESRTES